jgi:hypothetical protein
MTEVLSTLLVAALAAVAILVRELNGREQKISQLRGQLEELRGRLEKARAKLRKRTEPAEEAPSVPGSEPWIPTIGIESVAFNHLLEGATIGALGTALGKLVPIALQEDERLREQLRQLGEPSNGPPDESPGSHALDLLLALGAIELMRETGWKIVRLRGEVYKIDGWSP